MLPTSATNALRSLLNTHWQDRWQHPLFQRLWRSRVVWVTVTLVMGTIYGIRSAGWLQSVELATYDAQVRLRPSQGRDDRFLIVGIDEQDLQAIQEWPIPDCVLANALTKIKRHSPSTIGLDLYRNLPVPNTTHIPNLNQICPDETKRKGTELLYKVFRSTPKLVGIEKRTNDAAMIPVKPPPILNPTDQIGVNNLVIDSDNRIRRALFYFDEGADRYPSFALNLALNYLEQKKIAPEEGSEFVRLKGHSFLPFEAHDGGYNRADAGGYQILINYRDLHHSFDRVSLRDLLFDRVPDQKIRGRVVLIGSTATSLNDIYSIPHSRDFYSAPQPVPGVEIHAHIISHILSTVLDDRPEIQVLPDSIELLWVLAWTTFTAVLYGTPRQVTTLSQRLRGREGVLVLELGLFLGLAQGAMTIGWWLPVVPTGLGILGAVLGITIYQAWSAAELRKTFGRYLTDEVVYQLLDTPQGLQMGGDRRTVTMLMADLRGFSSASEQQSPERVLMFLNQYLEIMTDVINQYQGTIDEFMGDGILVLFGAPTTRDDDPDRAVACAIAMQQAMQQVNDHAPLLGLTRIEMGVGIHTGEVVVGNIGSLKRAKYGIVGSHMNLTARIESYTVGGQVLISDTTKQAVRSIVQTHGLLQIETKGFQQAVTLYEVRGIEGRFHLALPEQSTALTVLDELVIPIPVQFAVIEGKHIQSTRSYGLLRQVSAQGALLQSPTPLLLFCNLKLNLNQPDRNSDFYAKVTREFACDPAVPDQITYQIRFTFIPSEVSESLQMPVLRPTTGFPTVLQV
jgi:adenylate cyclase